jgi:DNA replication protein DnaC
MPDAQKPAWDLSELQRKCAANAQAAHERHANEAPPVPPREDCLRVAGLPLRWHGAKYDLLAPDLKAAVDDWLGHFLDYKRAGEGLWLVGPKGVGKTSAFAVIIDKLCEAMGYHPGEVLSEIRYYRASDLFGDLAQRDDGPAQDIPLLFIDDLGTEYDAAWPMARFAALADHRYGELLPTFIASNLSPEDLAKQPGWERTVDRWMETTRAYGQKGDSRREPPR